MTITVDQPTVQPERTDLDTLVTALRARIDDLDRMVVDIVAERRVLSRRIQEARVAAGGVRVELSRERDILEAYSASIGSEGVALATAVLRTCRGKL